MSRNDGNIHPLPPGRLAGNLGELRQALQASIRPPLRRRRVLAALAALALLPGLSRISYAQSACQTSNFSPKPIAANAGFFNAADLVLLDNSRQELLRFGDDGRSRGTASRFLSKSLTELDPISVTRRTDGRTGDGRIIILGEYNQFLILTPDYTFERGVDVLSRSTREGPSIERIYTWAPTWSPDRKDIVAFADLKKGEQWSTGIVRFPVDTRSDTRGQVVKDLSVTDVSRKFHRLGYPLISSLKEEGFVLLMENGFRLWKSTAAGEFKELTRFHDSFPPKEVPVLPAFVRIEDYSAIMNEVEAAAMPTGIHSWEDSLYVVWRRPQAGGGTEWLLSKVRSGNGRIVATLAIGSHANHLFAVPGKESWAFVEKGPVLEMQDQEVRSVLTVDAERLRAAFAAAEARGTTKAPLNLCP